MHVPAMLQEVLDGLKPRPGCVYLDGTLGGGGYSEAILAASQPDGRVAALDLDEDAVARAVQRLAPFGARFIAIHGGFHRAAELLAEVGITALDGAVLDLGLSSDQVDDPDRGFSFRVSGPLDMRFDRAASVTASSYLAQVSLKELEEILATYGEERYCKRLARAILAARDRGRLQTTADLARVVSEAIGNRRGKIHPATRTFQALRIAVNRELEHLEKALDEIPMILNREGRFCVVSYHSLEDRLVKQSFRERRRSPEQWRIVTTRPIRPSSEEVTKNPRARSARLRILEAV